MSPQEEDVEPVPTASGEKVPTRDEMDERIDFTATLLGRRLPKSSIKRLLGKRYGVGWRTCENYITRARKLILKWTGKTKEEHHNEALALYESVIRAAPDVKDRMTAQGRIDKLLGLEAPARAEVSGTDGKAIEVVVARLGQGLSMDDLK